MVGRDNLCTAFIYRGLSKPCKYVHPVYTYVSTPSGGCGCGWVWVWVSIRYTVYIYMVLTSPICMVLANPILAGLNSRRKSTSSRKSEGMNAAEGCSSVGDEEEDMASLSGYSHHEEMGLHGCVCVCVQVCVRVCVATFLALVVLHPASLDTAITRRWGCMGACVCVFVCVCV
jgi:hypothetical protein